MPVSKGGRVGSGNTRNPARAKKGGRSQRVPQLGPLKPKNAPQQAGMVDLNPHPLTHPPMPAPEQLGHWKRKKKKAA